MELNDEMTKSVFRSSNFWYVWEKVPVAKSIWSEVEWQVMYLPLRECEKKALKTIICLWLYSVKGKACSNLAAIPIRSSYMHHLSRWSISISYLTIVQEANFSCIWPQKRQNCLWVKSSIIFVKFCSPWNIFIGKKFYTET